MVKRGGDRTCVNERRVNLDKRREKYRAKFVKSSLVTTPRHPYGMAPESRSALKHPCRKQIKRGRRR